MSVSDHSSRPQAVWWRRRFIRFVLLGFALFVVFLTATKWYYRGLKADSVNLEVASGFRFVSETEGAIRVKLLDTVKNQAVSGVPIEIELVDPNSNKVASLIEFKTDDSGSGPAHFRLPDWAAGNYKLRVTAKVEDAPEVIEKEIRLERHMRLMLSTDKPIYQPGQVIHLRALGLRLPDLKPVAEESSTLSIVDPKGNLVFKEQPKTNAFGIVAVDFQLADEVIEGAYTISAFVRGVESKITVEVKPYVLPKFRIDIRTDKPYYRPGEKVKGTVQATYFHGKPVAGDVVIDSSPRVVQQIGKTNEKGEIAFEDVLPVQLFSRSALTPDRLELKVKVTDSAGQENTRSLSVNVLESQLMIEAIPENGNIVAGVPNRVFILVTTPDGKPALAKVTIGETVLATDARGVAVWEATPEGGILAPNISVVDSQNQKASRSFTFAVGTSNRDFLMRLNRSIFAAGDPLKLTVQAGGTEPVFVDLMQGGQVIRTATVEIKDGKGELALDLPAEWFGPLEILGFRVEVNGNVIRKKRTIFVRPAKELTIKGSFEPAGGAANQLLTGGLGVSTTFRPGEPVKLTLSLTDSEGKPAPGAISLVAVDEAVFHVLNDVPGTEKSFFLESDLSGNNLPPIDLFGPPPPGFKGEAKEAPPSTRDEALFARTAISLNSVTEKSLKQETYPKKVQETETRRKDGLAWVARLWDYFGMVVIAVVALVGLIVMHRVAGMFVDSPATAWQIAIPGMMMLIVLVIIINASPEYGAKKDTFDLISAPVSPTAGGKGFGVKKGERGDRKEEGPGGESVRVRKLFPETLLWKPTLITDNQGNYTLPFDLADSITSWRFTASGVNASGQLGSWRSDLVVTQPFFVDLNLPVRLTRGDEITVPIVVSNYHTEAQKIKLNLKKADWFEPFTELNAEIELKPNEVKSVGCRLKALKVGRHTFEVLATAGDFGDAVQRSIEVIPDGRRVELVANGVLSKNDPKGIALQLTLPQNAIEGSSKLFVKFYPSSFSQLVEGMDAIFKMPTGCFEQTSSSTYPNVLALSYLKQINKSMPDVEATARQYINAGYQRLLTFEVPGGGFDWYGRAPANRTLTAYGLMEFRDMAKVHSVDPKLISRTRDWLLQQRQPDGTWIPEGWNPGHRHVAPQGQLDLMKAMNTAYIAWAVFGGDEKADAGPTKKYLLDLPVKTLNDPYLLAMLANAFLNLDEKDAATAVLNRLDELKKTSKEGDQIWWERKVEDRTVFHGAGLSGDIETTALVVLAKSQAKFGAASIKPSLVWLTKQRDAHGTWHNTQATILTLKALISGTQPGSENVERKLLVSLQGEKKDAEGGTEVVIPANQSDVVKQLDLSSNLTASDILSLQSLTETETNYQVTFRYHLPNGEAKENNAFPVRFNLDKQQVKVGETITATFRTVNSNPHQDAAMVLIELPVPVGFTAQTEEFAALVKNQKIDRYQIQPDRVLVYLRGMKTLDAFDLQYRLTAQLSGKVTLPGARVYEYYEPSRFGNSLPLQVVIE
jgi:uncharacterized protein YfaS (alpha-2-macroglobulin family)